jgi:hypothetical protein
MDAAPAAIAFRNSCRFMVTEKLDALIEVVDKQIKRNGH